MEDDDLIVGGEAEVALDPRARFKRRRERDQAVFDERRAVVNPAMREPVRARIERIRA